jgi:phosphoglycolate phosphatase
MMLDICSQHRQDTAQYRHVIFDFDGVLCDSLAAATKAFNALRESFPALPEVLSRDDMVTVYGGSLKTCLSQWLTDEEHKAFFDRHSALMSECSRELDLFPDISDTLNTLQPGIASLVTSAYADHVSAVLARASPAVEPNQFYAIAGREVKATKTIKIRDLAARLNLALSDCVYVGDLESDILYCRDAPVDVIAVTYGYHPRWHLEACRPTRLVDTVAELNVTLERTLIANRSA